MSQVLAPFRRHRSYADFSPQGQSEFLYEVHKDPEMFSALVDRDVRAERREYWSWLHYTGLDARWRYEWKIRRAALAIVNARAYAIEMMVQEELDRQEFDFIAQIGRTLVGRAHVAVAEVFGV